MGVWELNNINPNYFEKKLDNNQELIPVIYKLEATIIILNFLLMILLFFLKIKEYFLHKRLSSV